MLSFCKFIEFKLKAESAKLKVRISFMNEYIIDLSFKMTTFFNLLTLYPNIFVNKAVKYDI